MSIRLSKVLTDVFDWQQTQTIYFWMTPPFSCLHLNGDGRIIMKGTVIDCCHFTLSTLSSLVQFELGMDCVSVYLRCCSLPCHGIRKKINLLVKYCVLWILTEVWVNINRRAMVGSDGYKLCLKYVYLLFVCVIFSPAHWIQWVMIIIQHPKTLVHIPGHQKD